MNVTLFKNRVFVDDWVKISSVGWAPILNDCVLVKRKCGPKDRCGPKGQMCTQGRCDVKLGVMLLQGRNLAEARSVARSGFFPVPSEGCEPAGILISDLLPPEL